MINLFNVLAKCTSKNYACANVVGKEGIPGDIVSIINYLYIGIQVIVPVVLILFGMIELGKAVTSQKEDEIKKAQSSFFKKLIVAVLVFLTLSVVKFVFDFAGGADNIWSCIDDVLHANCG